MVDTPLVLPIYKCFSHVNELSWEDAMWGSTLTKLSKILLNLCFEIRRKRILWKISELLKTFDQQNNSYEWVKSSLTPRREEIFLNQVFLQPFRKQFNFSKPKTFLGFINSRLTILEIRESLLLVVYPMCSRLSNIYRSLAYS